MQQTRPVGDGKRKVPEKRMGHLGDHEVTKSDENLGLNVLLSSKKAESFESTDVPDAEEMQKTDKVWRAYFFFGKKR